MTAVRILLAALLLAAPSAVGQVLPDGADAIPFDCPPRRGDAAPAPTSEAEREESGRRARYRVVLPAYLAAVPSEPDPQIIMPVEGVRVAQVADTWGAARGGGRRHEGQDIFAPEGTPVRSATHGFVYRIGPARLGGNVVTVVGAGGRRYYYAHLSRFADIREGQAVTPDTVLGYVGSTGNAAGTPPHLHFGVYEGREHPCSWDALDPLPLLVDR